MGGRSRVPIEDRWRSRTVEDAGCLIYTTAQDAAGYARMWDGARTISVHRWVYERFVGPVPDGLVLDHLCRRPACCLPSHLEPVRQGENVARGFGWAAENGRKTHCVNGHEFTPENTRLRPLGRECRRCHADQERARRAASSTQLTPR